MNSGGLVFDFSSLYFWEIMLFLLIFFKRLEKKTPFDWQDKNSFRDPLS